MDHTHQEMEDQASDGENAQLKLCFGYDCFPVDAIRKLEVTEWMEDRHIAKSMTAVMAPPDGLRWNYQAETLCQKDGKTIHRGFCVRSDTGMDGSVEMFLRGYEWELDQVTINGFEPFGMSEKEILYWLPQIDEMVRGVTMPDLT